SATCTGGCAAEAEGLARLRGIDGLPRGTDVATRVGRRPGDAGQPSRRRTKVTESRSETDFHYTRARAGEGARMRDWLALTGRSAFVVGAGGLGGAAARALSDQGARVVVADVDAEKLDRVARAAKDAGADLRVLVCDVRSAEGCRALVEEAAAL